MGLRQEARRAVNTDGIGKYTEGGASWGTPLCTGLAVVDAANSHVENAVLEGLCAAILYASHRSDVKKGQLAAFIAGMTHQDFSDGAIEKYDCPPIYTSLTGRTEIRSVVDLVASIGNSPTDIALKVGISINHAQGRRLTTREAETLRKAQAVIKVAPEIYKGLCPEGKVLADKIDGIVDTFEQDYYSDHSRVTGEASVTVGHTVISRF